MSHLSSPQEVPLLKLQLACVFQVIELSFSPVVGFSQSPQLLVSLKGKVLLRAMESKTPNSHSHTLHDDFWSIVDHIQDSSPMTVYHLVA